MWDSLYIDGTRTDKDGNEVSKNWLQELIKKNIEWEGSRLQSLVEEDISIDDLSTEPHKPNPDVQNGTATVDLDDLLPMG